MKCCCCEKEITNDEIGLTKKLISKNAKEFFCIQCLADYLCTTEEILLDKINQFKDEGCDLFV